MERRTQAELLDALSADDPRAVRSRRDLRRINVWMGNARLAAAALGEAVRRAPPRRIVDLGAGDGHCLRHCLRRLPTLPPGLELVLVDRRDAADRQVLTEFRSRGFTPRVEPAEVLDWLRATPAQPGTWMLANLFLHHFTAAALDALLAFVAEKSVLFCACEPRRAWWPLVASRGLGLIGASAVTRHDAAVSVRAGFAGEELSARWPGRSGWRLRERRAGRFSHLFLAQRIDAAAKGG